MDYTIILRNGRYALLDMGTQYVVACGFDGNQPKGQQWGQGYYYSTYKANQLEKLRIFLTALECFRELSEQNYIPRCRLEELATKFKDGLIEDDEESAMEYFDEVCEMTDEEKEWFGIGTESEEE